MQKKDLKHLHCHNIFHIPNCTMSSDRSAAAAAADASSITRTTRTGRIRPSGSSSTRDGISWECSNLLHFDDICRELDEEEEMDVDQLHDSSSSSLALRPRAVASDGTLTRISSVDTFRSRVIEKHTSSGSLSRVTSLSTNASNGSSLRSYLSFSSGPDAAAGPARRLGNVTTSNANFDSRANNNDQQRQRNAAASSAGRSMLGRN